MTNSIKPTMQKSTKILAIIAIVGAMSMGTGQAFGETLTIDTGEQTVQIVAIVATVAGALVAVGAKVSKLPDGESLSIKKSISAVITAVMASFMMVNLGAVASETSGMTLFGIIMMYFILGYGVDKGLSRLDK